MKYLYLTVGVITLGFITLSSLEGTSNLASIITGVNNDFTAQCVALINSKNGTAYTAHDYNFKKVTINTHASTDYIMYSTNSTQCGSAGCLFQICSVINGTAHLIPFTFAGKKLTVNQTISNGMFDLTLVGNSTTAFSWDGNQYQPQSN